MSRPPRLALVGVGRFGRQHLRVLRDLDRGGHVRFAGVIGRNASRARILARRLGVDAFPSLGDALASGLDAVDVATPAATHAAIVRRCLPHAHVFVEKPLALTVAECAALYRLARRHRRVLAVGHIYRFNAAVAWVKSLLQRQQPHGIRVELTGWSEPPGDVGALMTYLHVFDVLDELLPRPPRATTCLASRNGGGHERHATALVEYAGGLTALLEVGWIGGERRRRLDVSFPRLSVRGDLVTQTIERHRPGRPVHRSRLVHREPLRAELEHFLACVRGRAHVRPDPAAVLRVMRMVQDAQRSARYRRRIRWAS